MIPSNKSEPKHLKVEGARRARKSNKNSLKKTRKSHELQEGDRRNNASFHSLVGQILYKQVKNVNLWSKENEKQSGRMVCPETLELIYMSPSGPGKRPSYP
jgi:DUF4097 and DUF4098 domain-containing protein YvlB